MSLQTFLFYLATWLLVALTPGPAVMFSVAQATRGGFRSSLAGISGIQFGNLLFFVGVALGLGTLLATGTTAFTVLQAIGAIYLFYLGVRVILQSFRRPDPSGPQTVSKVATGRSLFAQGLLIQLTNPKALLFISSLLPQFIDRHRSVPLQLVILVLTTVGVDFLVLSSYAFVAHCGARSFRTWRWAAWLERAYGAALAFFGVRLFLGRN